MVVGTKEETVREKYLRYKNEAKENVKARENELSIAQTYYENDI